MGQQALGTLIDLVAGDATERAVLCLDRPAERIAFAWEPPGGLDEIGAIDSWPDRGIARSRFLSSLQSMLEGVDTFAVPVGQGAPGPLLDTVVLGSLQDPRRIVSASSPQRPALIVFAANWNRVCTRRVAANVLHELVHQVLYQREDAAVGTVRSNSIGYSPWKLAERPGRWVWHSFWTFALHCAYLAETARVERAVSEEDRLEVALMYLRLRQCMESIEMFEVVADPSELQRMRRALSVVMDAVEGPGGDRLFCDLAAAHAPRIGVEFEAWKARLLRLHRNERS